MYVESAYFKWVLMENDCVVRAHEKIQKAMTTCCPALYDGIVRTHEKIQKAMTTCCPALYDSRVRAHERS